MPPPALTGVTLRPTDERPEEGVLAAAEGALSQAALHAARDALAPFREAVARRNRRDTLRVYSPLLS